MIFKPWTQASYYLLRFILFQKSRAEAILEKSRQNKASASVAKAYTSSGATDVLEKAKAWGIEIWSLNKLYTWLDKFKSRSRLAIKRKISIINVFMKLYETGF